MLRTGLVLWGLFFLVLYPTSYCPGQAEKRVAVGELSFFIGDVRIRPQGERIWQKPQLNQTIFNGDALRSGEESRAEVTLANSDVIRIGEQTIFEFEDLKIRDSKVSGKGRLKFGAFWSRMKKLDSQGVSVRSPNAVMAIRGTTWRADAAKDSSLAVWVYEGAVDINRLQPDGSIPAPPSKKPSAGPPQEIAPPTEIPGPYEISLEEWIQITSGTQLHLRKDGRYAAEKIDLQADAKLDWVKWNLERDARLK